MNIVENFPFCHWTKLKMVPFCLSLKEDFRFHNICNIFYSGNMIATFLPHKNILKATLLQLVIKLKDNKSFLVNQSQIKVLKIKKY